MFIPIFSFIAGVTVGASVLALAQYGIRWHADRVRRLEWAKIAAEQAKRDLKNEASRKRYADNPQVPLRSKARTVVRNAIYVEQKFRKEYGYKIGELIGSLECRFDPSMTFDNFGDVWEIDHVRPLMAFDLTDQLQFCQAIHPSNLQPLFRGENQSKGAK